MSPIETIAKPRRNRISVQIPREYSSYSFQVILVPLVSDTSSSTSGPVKPRRRKSFVNALLACPKLEDGEELDIFRDKFVTRNVDDMAGMGVPIFNPFS